MTAATDRRRDKPAQRNLDAAEADRNSTSTHAGAKAIAHVDSKEIISCRTS